MQHFLPATSHLQPIAKFAAMLDLQPERTLVSHNSALGSILSNIVFSPCYIFDLTEFDDLVTFRHFTKPRYPSAFLAALNLILITHGHSVVDVHADLEQFRWGQFFGERKTTTTNNPWDLRNKAINNRRYRPSWATDDWKLAQEAIGTPALIAQMEWRDNMNPTDIAAALDMKPATVQKAIARMGNDVKRLGLREGFQVGGSISRFDFALLELKEQGMSDKEAANHLMHKWFGESTTTRCKIAVMFWQWNMSAVDIAEELEMSVGAVDNIIYRLQGE